MASPKKKISRKDKVEALRALSMDELIKKLAENEDELMRARFKHATATLEDTAMLKTKRREIARIQTVMNEKLRSA
ncbi:MAG: 50S ribosomal protein L29 [Desulfovibrio sp.]|nr:50S ribosomal protein L29 [Desulfovibrio sp.]